MPGHAYIHDTIPAIIAPVHSHTCRTSRQCAIIDDSGQLALYRNIGKTHDGRGKIRRQKAIGADRDMPVAGTNVIPVTGTIGKVEVDLCGINRQANGCLSETVRAFDH